MKKALLVCKYVFLAAISFPSLNLFSLPQSDQVISGDVHFARSDEGTLQITTSDRSIVNYSSFNVAEGERINFIQPDTSSSVLNRVVGKDPSSILGKIESNGRVFLVNPNGIYFGKNAVVNVGSLIASTLDISNENFKGGHFKFSLNPEKGSSSILNEGVLSSSAEGSIVLLAPHIQNDGAVLAKAGKVVFASAKQVTLDFTGDGLIGFALEGVLEEACIKQEGEIDAAGGDIFLKMMAAKSVIEDIVNTEGIVVATKIVKTNGKVHLVNSGRMIAAQVEIEGERVIAEGSIVSKSEGEGGLVKLLGEHIELKGASIDASGDFGGGEVYVGGNYQGKGPLRNAQIILMDEDSVIKANAVKDGDGGQVILWADGQTFFNGKIIATAGEEGGNGGFVETSGKEGLEVLTGFADTRSKCGDFGSWLLDPAVINIESSGAGTRTQAADCFSFGILDINNTALNGWSGDIILCARSAINVNASINAALSDAHIIFTTGGEEITTTISHPIISGSGISFNGYDATHLNTVILDADITLTAGGGGVTFGEFSTLNASGFNLTIDTSSSGIVSLQGPVGALNALNQLTITNDGVFSTSAIANINLGGSFSQNGQGDVFLRADITTVGDTISFGKNLTLNDNVSLNTTGGGVSVGSDITFSETLNGGKNLTLNAGTGGDITFSGAVGGTTPLTALTVTNADIVLFSSTLETAGDITIFATGCSFNNSVITTTGNMDLTTKASGAKFDFLGGTVTLDGTYTMNTGITLLNAPLLTAGGVINLRKLWIGSSGGATVDSTNNGAVSIGANITVGSDIIAGAGRNLTLKAGTSGNIALGGTASVIGVLTIDSAKDVTFSGTGSMTAGKIVQTNVLETTTVSIPLTTTGADGIDLTGTDFTIKAAINTTGSGPVSITNNNGGTLTTEAAGNMILDGSFTQGGSGANELEGDITTTGDAISFLTAVTLNDNISLDTTSGPTPIGNDITFTSTVAGAQTLTLDAGTGGTVTFTGEVGGGAGLDPTSITVTYADTVTANAITVGSFTQSAGTTLTTFNGALTTTGASGIDLIGKDFTIKAAINTTGSGPVSITNNNGGTLTTEAAGNMILDGSFTQGGSGANELEGDITTTGDAISFLTAVTLNDNISLDTTSGPTPIGNDITFTSTVAGAQTLTLDAGTGGTITFTGEVGGGAGPDPTLITVTNAYDFTSSNPFKVGSFNQIAGTNITTFSNSLTTTGSSGITIIAMNALFESSVTTTGGGSINLTATAGNDVFSFSNGAETISVDGAFTVHTGTLYTKAALLTRGGAIDTGDRLWISTSGITLDSTHNGSVVTGADITISPTMIVSTGNLTLRAGTTGDIVFQKEASPGIGNLLIISANDVTFSSAGGAGYSASSIVQSAGEGTTYVNDTLTTTGASGVSLSGTNFTISAAITSSGSGPVSITNSGTLKTTATGDVAAGGGFTQAGIGPVELARAIITTGDAIIFNGSGAITLHGTVNLNTTVGPSPGANITFNPTLDGAQVLNLTAGTGTINFANNVGFSAPLSSITATGSIIDQDKDVRTTGNISYTGTNGIQIGNVTTPANVTATTGAIEINNNLTLEGDVVVNTFLDAITFGGTINGAYTLTVDSGDEAISFANMVGNLTKLTALDVTASNIQIGADQSATSLTYHGPVELTDTTIFQGGAGGGVTFDQTIGSDASRPFNIGDNSGTITFGGNVGTVSQISSIDLGTSAVFLKADVTFTLAGSPGIGFIFPSTIDSSDATARSLVLATGNGGVTFTGNIGGTNPLSSLDANDNPVTLNGTVSLVTNGASGVNFGDGSTVDGGQDFTITSSGGGSVNFLDFVGNGPKLNKLDVTADGGINVYKNHSAATLRYQSPVSLLGATSTFTFTPEAGGVKFDSTIAGTGKALLVATGTTAGPVTFIGAVGDVGTELTSIDVTGTIVNLGASQYAGPMTYNSPVNLTASLTLQSNNATGITFKDNINGNQALVVTGGVVGPVSFEKEVGTTTALSSLEVTGTLIKVSGDHKASGGTLTYNSPVLLMADGIKFEDTGATGITFNNKIDSNAGHYSMTLDASAQSTADVTIVGAVGSNRAIKNLTILSGDKTTCQSNVNTAGPEAGDFGGVVVVNAGGDILFSGDLTTTGGDDPGGNGGDAGDVTINSTGGNVTVSSITSTGGAGANSGGAGGDILLQPAPGFSSNVLATGDKIPNGRLFLNGNLIALGGAGTSNGVRGAINLSLSGRTEFLSVATVFGSGSTIIQGHSLSMGMNETMTVFGDLDIDTISTAFIQDIIATGTLTIGSNVILIRKHAASNILNSEGQLVPITQTSLLSYNSTTLTGTTIQTGTGSSATISTVSDQFASSATFQAALTYGGYALLYDRGDVTPPTPPTPLTPSTPAAAAAAAAAVIPKIFVAGIYDVDFSLGSDFYFLKDWIDACTINPRIAPLYYMMCRGDSK